jgi:hypothetical protein
MNDFQALINDPSYDVRLARVPLLGHLEDIGPYNRAWSFAYSDHYWSINYKGHGLNTAGFNVSHGAEQSNVNGTLFIASNAFLDNADIGVANQRLMSKRLGAAVHWDFRISSLGGGRLYLFSDVASFVNILAGNRKTISCSFSDGNNPLFYVDDIYVGQGSSILNITATADPIYIGSYSSAGTEFLQSQTLAACLFGAQLTHEQIKDLNQAWDSLIVGIAINKENFPAPFVSDDVTELAHLAMEQHDGKIIDISMEKLLIFLVMVAILITMRVSTLKIPLVAELQGLTMAEQGNRE